MCCCVVLRSSHVTTSMVVLTLERPLSPISAPQLTAYRSVQHHVLLCYVVRTVSNITLCQWATGQCSTMYVAMQPSVLYISYSHYVSLLSCIAWKRLGHALYDCEPEHIMRVRVLGDAVCVACVCGVVPCRVPRRLLTTCRTSAPHVQVTPVT